MNRKTVFWTIVRWAVIGVMLAVATHLKHPLLYRVRGLETPLLLAAALGGLWLARRALARQPGRWLRVEKRAQMVALLAVAGFTAGNEAWFRWQQHEVLAAGPAMRRLGAHFIVGVRDFDSIRPLAEQGLIGGIYINRASLGHRSAAELRREIDSLQAARAAHGLPPLFVAADQEGGTVSHLSPLVAWQPPLATLAQAGDAPVRQYGEQQGRELAALGVNMNLSPVVDLRPAGGHWVDLHTQIRDRAISDDPAVVSRVAAAYSDGLVRAGVQPTVKHFPGLGQVQADTHLVKARLQVDAQQLAADFQPFREVTARTGAAMMLGHVTVPAIDPKHPASLSKAVANDLLRQQWGYQGLLMTDDLNMGAVYADGIGNAATQALDAGVDLLLVTYDPDQYWRAMHTALRSWRGGRISSLRETESAQRIATFWRDKARKDAALGAAAL